jgi:hypothetical protein
MSEVTHLMDAAAAGDRQAAADVLPLVYDELGKLAAARRAAEKPGHTLSATAFAHEAYLRPVGDSRLNRRPRTPAGRSVHVVSPEPPGTPRRICLGRGNVDIATA